MSTAEMAQEISAPEAEKADNLQEITIDGLTDHERLILHMIIIQHGGFTVHTDFRHKHNMGAPVMIRSVEELNATANEVKSTKDGKARLEVIRADVKKIASNSINGIHI